MSSEALGTAVTESKAKSGREISEGGRCLLK